MSTVNMVRQALNGMTTLLLTKFMLNDVPHAAGLLPNPTYSPTATVYHVTSLENLDSILKKGLVRDNQYIFFIHDYKVAYNQAKSMAEEGDSYALLKVTLMHEDINRCDVGEMFPDLYTEKFGAEPPTDMPLYEFMEYPKGFMIAEIACEVDKVPPERIAVLKKFEHTKGD